MIGYMALMPLPPTLREVAPEDLQHHFAAALERPLTGAHVVDARANPPEGMKHRTRVPYLLVVMDGRLSVHIGEAETVLRPGDAAFYVSGTGFRTGTKHANVHLRMTWDEDHCLIARSERRGGSGGKDDIRGYRSPGRPTPLVLELEERLRRMAGNATCCRSYMHCLLADAYQQLLDANRPVQRRLSRRSQILAYLQDHLPYELSRQRVARAIGVHPGHISRLIRQEFGCGYIELVRRLRVQRARQMLRESELDLRSIATACGFKSPSRFSSSFHREMGCSPLQWRRQQATRG